MHFLVFGESVNGALRCVRNSRKATISPSVSDVPCVPIRLIHTMAFKKSAATTRRYAFPFTLNTMRSAATMLAAALRKLPCFGFACLRHLPAFPAMRLGAASQSVSRVTLVGKFLRAHHRWTPSHSGPRCWRLPGAETPGTRGAC